MNHEIRVLFLDVGGVLLTNGWDRDSRAKAVERFGLELKEMEGRHQLAYDTYESGRMSLEEYLTDAVFYQPRSFSREDFFAFMLTQSQPYAEMIDYIRKLKLQHKLKVVVVSNEGRDLTLHRIHKFGLIEFVDFFVFSCFVHLRKPDPAIYRLALDLAQVQPEEVIYIDDRELFIEIAAGMGIHAIHHVNIASTQSAVEELLIGRAAVSNKVRTSG
jgi:putative hydrolase of the HAD superfamily